MDIVTAIEKFKAKCTDSNGHFDKDYFRVLIVLLQLGLKFRGKDLEDYYSEMNKQIYRFLGAGHSLSSCMQFMQGKKGQVTLDRVKDKMLEDAPPSLIKEIVIN